MAGGRARRRRVELVAVQSSLDSDDASWFFAPSSSVLDRLADVTINGTHPLLPWLAFLCTGIVLGRQLRTDWWRPVALSRVRAFRRCFARLVVDRLRTAGYTTVQHRSLRCAACSTASALGTALIAFAVISWLADRFVRDSGRAAAPCRRDDPVAVRRPCVGVQPRRRLAGVGRPDRTRRRSRSPRSTGSSPSPSPRGTTADSASARSVVYRVLEMLQLGERVAAVGVTGLEAAPEPRHRCSDEPLGPARMTCPCVCCWMRSSPTAAAALSASPISPGSS